MLTEFLNLLILILCSQIICSNTPLIMFSWLTWHIVEMLFLRFPTLAACRRSFGFESLWLSHICWVPPSSILGIIKVEKWSKFNDRILDPEYLFSFHVYMLWEWKYSFQKPAIVAAIENFWLAPGNFSDIHVNFHSSQRGHVRFQGKN